MGASLFLLRVAPTAADRALVADEFRLVSLVDDAGTDDERVETELPAKSTYDVSENAGILSAGVRIDGRHHAALPQIGEAGQQIADSKDRASPIALFNTGDAFDEQVWTKASTVTAEQQHGAIGADEQRQHVEPLGALESVQPWRRAMLAPFVQIRSLHQFPLRADEPEGSEAAAVGLAYFMGWGLLTRTRFGPAFFKEGHGDGAQNYMIWFDRRQTCMILLTNSDNGELAFRPLLETILGDTVTPWGWEGYTPAYIQESRRQR